MSKPLNENTRSRSVTMTERDWKFLYALGGNNASSGIRIAVVLAKTIGGQPEYFQKFLKENNIRSSVKLTDHDKKFLFEYGGNNVDAGIAVAVSLARDLNAKFDYIPKVNVVDTKI